MTLALAGCGGNTRQDVNEKSANYKVAIVDASFPAAQKLAQTSKLVIRVRNDGGTAIPNIAMTVNGFDKRKNNPDLANPERPQFVINARRKPKGIGGLPDVKDAAPTGCETVYVNTWACGRLRAGAEKTFAWDVTAVEAGKYKLSYRVAAGLNGKAKVLAGGNRVTSGSFAGEVSDKPPATRVSDKDGKTLIRGTR